MKGNRFGSLLFESFGFYICYQGTVTSTNACMAFAADLSSVYLVVDFVILNASCVQQHLQLLIDQICYIDESLIHHTIADGPLIPTFDLVSVPWIAREKGSLIAR